MLHKMTKRQTDTAATYIGNAVIGGSLALESVDWAGLADKFLQDPAKFSIMFGVWVLFYAFGKDPKEL